MILRAVERIDPRALHGRDWSALEYHEQIELLAFEDLRLKEESQFGSPSEPGR